MKKIILSLILLTLSLQAQNIKFEDYFENKTLRVDLIRTGDATTDITTLDQIYKQGEWAGNPNSLIDPFAMGRNRIKLYDLTQNKLIYSRGYDNYYGEYKTSTPALNGIKRTFFEPFLIPMPKRPVMLTLETRDKEYVYHVVYQVKIDPKDYHIIDETLERGDLIVKIKESGNPSEKVDLVFVGDGYSKKDEKKFRADLEKFSKILFELEPFAAREDDFNITGIMPYSIDSGVDQPTKRIYKNTALNCTFNSMDSPRYLLTEDTKALYDICAQVPMDAVAIMCNEDRYGGGGIYNFYATFTASNQSEDYVFIHEFGHSFAGLADEYYASETAYNEFYPRGIEPAEANITALLDKDNLKWKEYVSDGIEIPTEWGKETFDSLNLAVGKLRIERNEKLKSTDDTNKQKIKDEYSKKINETYDALHKFIVEHPLRGKIGAFEGAGYASEGLYRPTINSIMHMFKKDDKKFYPVSEQAINDMIDFYTK